jgi:acyl-CoA reductase-like NAD-dependent aldehyde dehydrogenase
VAFQYNTGFTMTIGGNAVAGKANFPVINPATEEVVANVPDCTAEQLDAAIAAARNAFPTWSAQPIAERRRLIVQMADTILANAEGLSRIMTAEQGKPLSLAVMELQGAVDWMKRTAVLELPEHTVEEGEHRASVRRVPLGVIALIPAWNFPVNLSAIKSAPALLSGNTVVLKPSPFTPLSMLKIGELLRGVLPAGVLNVVSGGDQLGPMMTAHRGFDKVSFTGSTVTGRKVMASAAPTLKRVTLELGGNDPAIVMPDVDVEAVAQQLFWCAFANSGQICMAVKRIYVHEAIYDAFAAAMTKVARSVKVGNGLDEGVQLGPISNRPQFQRVKEIIQDSIDNGHRILTGGQSTAKQGFFVPVTLIDNPPEDARIVQEEQFGPVLPLLRFDDINDALARANAVPYGLGASVWCRNPELSLSIAQRLQSGTVWINEPMRLSPAAPFGGHKQSGIGSEGGVEGLVEYTVAQTIWSKRLEAAAA